MWASAIVSEQEFLAFLWQASAALAGMSVLILFCLMAVRLHTETKDAYMTRRYKELSGYFYAALTSPGQTTKDALPALSGKDKAVACRIALDILRTVKGRDTESIARLLDAWELETYLIGELRTGRRGAKIQALSLLAAFKTPESFQAILSHCKNEDIYVQMTALRGLSTWHDTSYIDQVTRDLSSTQKANKLMLADVLKRFGEPAAASLVTLASGEALLEVRLAALIALGSIRPLTVVAPLVGLLQDQNESIRAQAADSLGKIGDIRAGAALTDRLDDSSIPVRIRAAQALGALRFEESLAMLEKKLDDPEWWVRFRAAEALHNMGDKGIALLTSLSSAQDRPGIIAAQVLAERKGS